MSGGLHAFWLCFVPFFVAVDPVGMVPLYLALTEGAPPEKLRRVIVESVVTATVVALGFVAIGVGALNLLGITMADFMIAGGVLLFVLALTDILHSERPHELLDPENLGAVPLGVPLITGPAVLTTSILLMHQHGALMTSGALILNMALLAGALFFANQIHRFIGKAGVKAISKVANLILAAFAVMFVRKGIALYVAGGLGS